jgi:hypothetical protein
MKEKKQDKTGNNKTWDRGGNCVWGDDIFKEALYALEDRKVWLPEYDNDQFIKADDMYEVMHRYEKFLKQSLINRIIS